MELNELKNVVLVNKALWDVDGVRLKLMDRGTASAVGEGDVEVDTVTVDSLGRFDVVKMDIEGAEGRVVGGEWLGHVREIGVELHGRDNIDAVLTARGFSVRFIGRRDLLLNTARNILAHPLGFLKAELRTHIAIDTLRGKYSVPALESDEVKIVYARRKV
ncbi:conserved hypothetical protein [Pyrobaculum islandicum DSM 4184]|uniref:Methyltransferase FkbM domain-containing protein n=1 Tax=Pyrobaculum islandicum (strain DSM 4184 / JCM 9189 / GEO3) TaxID=384616 RepID=A1RUM5_PYRIL|nr:conserved hypothetical protein [Pyrobaculum islandicum DSM 4184]